MTLPGQRQSGIPPVSPPHLTVYPGRGRPAGRDDSSGGGAGGGRGEVAESAHYAARPEAPPPAPRAVAAGLRLTGTQHEMTGRSAQQREPPAAGACTESPAMSEHSGVHCPGRRADAALAAAEQTVLSAAEQGTETTRQRTMGARRCREEIRTWHGRTIKIWRSASNSPVASQVAPSCVIVLHQQCRKTPKWRADARAQ